ncbi:hypothetical protein XENOCAPTIV_010213 [Xenoophorus captivus]|uniref:Uncharacterized protein n=1 Tax=Xenoophorus captivus TaxID=1517983 RepID=A0ABV0SGT6_9TELE
MFIIVYRPADRFAGARDSHLSVTVSDGGAGGFGLRGGGRVGGGGTVSLHRVKLSYKIYCVSPLQSGQLLPHRFCLLHSGFILQTGSPSLNQGLGETILFAPSPPVGLIL